MANTSLFNRYIFIATLSFFLIAFFFSCKKQNNRTQLMPNHIGSYLEEWTKIDSLEQEGLYKSALESVERLAKKAEKEKNSPQVIKTLMYRGKYAIYTGEEGMVTAIDLFEKEVQTAGQPEKSMLHSMLGELYSTYLQNQGWQIQNRTQQVGDEGTDIRTWSAERLERAAFRHYTESVDLVEMLAAIPVETYQDILTGHQKDTVTAPIRPTLFDFLGHRALSYFQNESNYMTEPTIRFFLRESIALAQVETFVDARFQSEDTTSRKLVALHLFQRILKQHLEDGDPSALVIADLQRLQFVYQNLVAPKSDKRLMYREVLISIYEKHAKNPVSAEVLLELAQNYRETGRNYDPNKKRLEGEKDLKYAVDYLELAIKNHPESYGGKRAYAELKELRSPRSNISPEAVVLPNEPSLACVEFTNIESVWVKIVSMDGKSDRYFDEMPHDDRWNAFKKLSTVHDWKRYDFPVEKDYRGHTTEVKIDALPIGHFAMLLSTNEAKDDKVSKCHAATFFASNIAPIPLHTDNESMYVVANRKTGAPMEGVDVEFYYQKWENNGQKEVPAGTIKTDKDGIAIMPNMGDRRSLSARFLLGKDKLDISNSLYPIRNHNRKPSQEVVFFTDRQIYRPGQTIYFKALLLEKDEMGVPKVQPNQSVEILFFDVNNQEKGKLNLKTNKYGTVNGSFTAPSSGLTGYMRIHCSNPRGAKSIQVEEYKRPKFEVNLEAPAQAVRVGETVKVTGKAMAFAGSSIDGAKVQYRIQRTARMPWWWGWCGWRSPWWSSRSAEIAFGEVKTEADGTFEIEFQAEPDREIPAEDKPEFNYEVSVEVTDITGETQRISTRLSVGYVALKADFPIRKTMSVQDLGKVAVRMTDLNGNALAAKAKVTIQPLLKPKTNFKKRYWLTPDVWTLDRAMYQKDFPEMAYKNADDPLKWPRQDFTWEVDIETPRDTFVDLVSKTNSRTTIKAGGAYLIRFEAKDAYGNPLEIERVVQVYDASDKSSRIVLGESLFFDDKNYEPNQRAQLFYGSKFEQQPILLWYASLSQKGIFQWKNPNKGLTGSQTLSITEKDRGQIRAISVFVRNNRVYGVHETSATVPWTNKDLNIEYGTFRDKLYPGAEEEWRIKISGAKKDAVAAEMVAAMYDESLDQFAPNSWQRNFFPLHAPKGRIGNQIGFTLTGGRSFFQLQKPDNYEYPHRSFQDLNWFGFPFYGRQQIYAMDVMGGTEPKRARRMMKAESAAVMAAPMEEADAAMNDSTIGWGGIEQKVTERQSDEEPTPPNPVRTNLKETVFFFPELYTDAQGDILLKFKMNEALTRWKFLAFAHTPDMQFAFSEKSVVTQKDLMVLPNPPRFFREGDKMRFAAKVSNLSKTTQSGTATLELFDAVTMQPLNAAYNVPKQSVSRAFEVESGRSGLVSWEIEVPKDGTGALLWRVVAKSGQFSDGEEDALPVMTNRTLVTETMPLAVRGNQKKTYTMEHLRDYTSSTLTHHKYSLEFTSNPAWYAVQVMPYLMEYPHDCSEQIFSRMYANSLAAHVSNSNPQIKRVYDAWRRDAKSSGALESNLSKNQELKTALLEETPWVLDAQNEAQQKANIALLFDLNKMSSEQARALTTLSERQSGNGGFPWFSGGRESWHITQHIASGIGHLAALGVELPSDATTIYTKAVGFCDGALADQYERLAERVQRKETKWEDDHLGTMIAQYLYMRSAVPTKLQLGSPDKKAYDYYISQAKTHWKTKNLYTQGQIALALHRLGHRDVAQQIVRSLKERSIQKEELGMYWAFDWGYYFYQMPVETQALMVEVFSEVANDKAAVDELRIWLLKNKQTNNWKTTKATAEAVYALLLGGDDWLSNSAPVEVTVGKHKIDGVTGSHTVNKREAGTGYFKTAFAPAEIKKDMATVSVDNPNASIAWGAAYWQYFEDLDKVDVFKETPLTIKKELFLEKNTATGPKLTAVSDNTKLSTGDKVKVRIEIRVDRAMEYVHLKDMRAAAFEPINVLSGYRWQDGLGYYESTKDLATHFFIDYLPKGTYVFEYPLVATQVGDFSNGITTMQCMYAPEFTSHSEGVRVVIQ